MADQPSGAVTFLFTDVEGSTRVLKQVRERYADVLAEHQRLLRAAFEAHEGYEVDTQGDSFFIAFSSAREALLAAVDGQQALAAHPWPDGAGIKVRMGLHTGHAIASGGRYTGLAVHRAARIGAVGHGGQILVSQATQTLLEDDEEDLGVSLQDLGEHRLKDLDRPVRLYQAAADGLPADFPPIRPGAEAPPVAPPLPLWRRPAARGVAVFGVVALVVAAVAALALRDGASSVPVVPNSVAIVDPENGRVVDDIPVGPEPGPVAFGAGSVWVGNLGDRTVTRIDSDDRTVRNITLDNRTPTGLAYGLDAVWVAHGRLGQVSRIDPQFNDVGPPIEVGGTAFGSRYGSVAVGAGSVWAVFGDSTLAQIDPATQRVEHASRAGTQPAGIAFGIGSLWVTNSAESNVTRYSPAAFDEALDEFKVGARPTAIAAGEAIWVANSLGGSVAAINPYAGDVITTTVGEAPSAIAVTPDAVWVANRRGGTLSRINPDTNEVEGTVEIGHAPSGIVLAEGLLWVTVQAP
jgi:class 3 adenylate cyclase